MNAEEIQARQNAQAAYMETRLALATQLMPELLKSFPERMAAPVDFGIDDENALEAAEAGDVNLLRNEVETSIVVDAVGYAEMLLEQNAKYTPYWAAPDVIQGDFGKSAEAAEAEEIQEELPFDDEDEGDE